MNDARREANEDKKTRRILGPEERRERNRQEMIDAILVAARDIMREEGVGGLTLQELANRVDMSPPSLYNYFPSKMAIYEAVFTRGIRLYRQSAEKVLEEHGPTTEGRRAAITNFMHFALQNPELFHLLFERPVPGFEPSEEGMDEARKLIAFSDRIVLAERAAGNIHDSISPQQARDILVAIMHGLAALHLANEPDLAVGEGRFGSLIPLASRAVDLLYEAGMPQD